MTPEQFVYWLQGYTEICEQAGGISEQQWKIICDHLKEVFHKKTPDYAKAAPNSAPVFPPYTQQQPTIIC